MIKITSLSKCPKSYTCLKSNITRHHAPMLFGKGFLKLTAPGIHINIEQLLLYIFILIYLMTEKLWRYQLLNSTSTTHSI